MKSWVIPPKQSEEFVAAMEDVLSIYKRRYNSKRPLVCIDELSKQLLADVHDAIPLKPGQPKKVDHEYKRFGMGNVFMAFEPLSSWRFAKVTERRTKVDFAYFIKELVDDWYYDVDKIIVVMDNLNTHTIGSLYKAFGPSEAFRLAQKLEIHHTPKHASWLNMAEIELSVLSRQLLKSRFGSIESLSKQVSAWQTARNNSGGTVDWQFTTKDARIKLKRLYPIIEM